MSEYYLPVLEQSSTIDSLEHSNVSSVVTRYKTKICRTYLEKGVCPYKNNCRFAHGVQQLRSTERNFKELIDTSMNHSINESDSNLCSRTSSIMCRKPQVDSVPFSDNEEFQVYNSIEDKCNEIPHLKPILNSFTSVSADMTSALPVYANDACISSSNSFTNQMIEIHNSANYTPFSIAVDYNKSTTISQSQSHNTARQQSPNRNESIHTDSSVPNSFRLFLAGNKSASSESKLDASEQSTSSNRPYQQNYTLFNAPQIPFQNGNQLNSRSNLTQRTKKYSSNQEKKTPIRGQNPVSLSDSQTKKNKPVLDNSHYSLTPKSTTKADTLAYSMPNNSTSSTKINYNKKETDNSSSPNLVQISQYFSAINTRLGKITGEISPNKEVLSQNASQSWWNMSNEQSRKTLFQ